MRGSWRQSGCCSDGQPRIPNFNDKRYHPGTISSRRRQKRRRDPDGRRGDQANDPRYDRNAAAPQRQNAGILKSQNQSNSTERRAESGCIPATERTSRVRGHQRDKKNLRDNQRPLQNVIDGELSGESRIAKPGKKYEAEQKCVFHYSMKGIVGI